MTNVDKAGILAVSVLFLLQMSSTKGNLDSLVFSVSFASHCIDSQLSRSYAFFPFRLVTMSLGSQLQPVVPRDCYGDGRSVVAATHVFVEKTTANIMAIVSTTVKVYEKPI